MILFAGVARRHGEGGRSRLSFVPIELNWRTPERHLGPGTEKNIGRLMCLHEFIIG